MHATTGRRAVVVGMGPNDQLAGEEMKQRSGDSDPALRSQEVVLSCGSRLGGPAVCAVKRTVMSAHTLPLLLTKEAW